jgi:uncharacterized protein YhaN
VKITDLQVDGFGVWKGLTVESLSDEVTIFVGQNEAGKTTLMQFIRAMMFGFSPDRLDKYTPPVYGGLAGGSLDMTTSSGAYEVQRFVDPNRHSDPIGDLAVTDGHDGSVHGKSHLQSLMSDIDESIFTNVFAIGLREIQELGALNSTAAADQLYRLTSGLDRVSLIDVMRDLKSRREVIWSPHTKADSRLSVLADRRTKLLREVDELKQRSKRWSSIASESNDVVNQLADLGKQLAELEKESRLIEVATNVSDRWQKRIMLGEQVKAYRNLPDSRDIKIEKLDEFNRRIALQKERIEEVKSQRRLIKKEAMALPINRGLWSQKSRIEAIAEHAPWVESLERQTHNLQDEINRIENSLVGEVDGLGHQLKIKTKDVVGLGNRGLSSLENAGGKLKEQQDRLTKLKQDMDKVEFDLGQHSDRLGSSMSEAGASDSLEETGRYVAKLRRRVELGEKIDKLNRSRMDLERDIDSVVNEQVLPVEKLSVIGAVFILGFVLLGFGIVASLFQDGSFANISKDSGVLFIILGAIAGFVSLALKYHWERMAKEELDDFRHQMDIIRQQLKRAKHDREEIERQLPPDSLGKYELELEDAQGRLNRLEDLVPLENRVQSSRSMLEDLRRRIAGQEREVETATEQWRANLRTTGLPETLQPHQLEEITKRSERIGVFHQKLDQFKSEKELREKELNALRRRIDGMLHETTVEFNSTRLTDRLAQITSAINDQRGHVAARKQLAAKYKSLRARVNKGKNELASLIGQKSRLLASVGAENEEIYRRFDAKHRELRKLRKTRVSLCEQITLTMGRNFKEVELEDLFNRYGVGGLESRWESVQEKLDFLKQQQSKLQQQRGELLQEVKSLGEDSRLDEVRLELNSIEAEIAQLKRQWQELGSSTQMLEMIRESYESKRQPETLKEASTYLSRLSEGKYTRIWTRLTGEELLVDNAEEETISVDKLSRGTREAVYLSLRLALVGAYARRGAVIPMVLDDVLVNFDGRRAHAAAELLCDFSRNGYQILMFTCHDHMRDMFKSLGADVRTLPSHRDVVESQATPARYESDGVYERQPVSAARPVVQQPISTERLVYGPQRIAVKSVASRGIPVEYVQRQSSIELTADGYDSDLEFELSAVETDQDIERQRLRNGLVYVSANSQQALDLSGNEPIWSQTSATTY